ncbi:MAG TPA: hypothetical protein VHY32_07875 [Caulobacteraceae bacterium]|nr:hypothetical protein [Caulobacteraceae bacterium]
MSAGIKVCASGLAAGFTLALAACGPQIKTDALNTDQASATCAAMDTAAEIKNRIFELAEKQTPASNRLALSQLAKQANLRIEAPLLDAYDAAAKKTTCSGQLHISLPSGAVRNLGDTSDLTAAIKYSAGPAKDRVGSDYEVMGADNLISGIAGADITDWASKLQPAGMPAEGAPVPAMASAVPPTAPAPAPIPAPQPTLPAELGASSSFPAPRPLVMARRTPPPGLANRFADLPPLPRCQWARSYADRTICGDPALAAEDRRIAILYRSALANDDTGEVRRVAQSERAAREGCQDRDCILEWFRQREADLSRE